MAMSLPLNAGFNNPNDYRQAYQNAGNFLQQLMTGPQGVPTMQMRQYAMNVANQLQNQLGSSYDDSWVKPWLGYNDPNAGLDLQQLQMQYAKQRAQNTGNFDSSWMPSLPQAQGPTMQQRNFALDWANTMGQNILPTQEALVQQFIAGNSPLLQGLQRQYVADLYQRGGGWNPNLVTAQAPAGVPTANQYLSNLGWGLNTHQVQGEAYNPATNSFTPTAQMQYSNFGQVGPTAIEASGGTDGFLRAVGQAAMSALTRAANAPANPSSTWSSGPLQQLKNGGNQRNPSFQEMNTASTQEPKWTAKDNADVEALKQTAQGMDKATFLNYIKQQPISSYVREALARWANQNMR